MFSSQAAKPKRSQQSAPLQHACAKVFRLELQTSGCLQGIRLCIQGWAEEIPLPLTSSPPPTTAGSSKSLTAKTAFEQTGNAVRVRAAVLRKLKTSTWAFVVAFPDIISLSDALATLVI